MHIFYRFFTAALPSLSSLTLPFPMLSYLILSCPILPYFILPSYPTLPLLYWTLSHSISSTPSSSCQRGLPYLPGSPQPSKTPGWPSWPLLQCRGSGPSIPRNQSQSNSMWETRTVSVCLYGVFSRIHFLPFFLHTVLSCLLRPFWPTSIRLPPSFLPFLSFLIILPPSLLNLGSCHRYVGTERLRKRKNWSFILEET